MKILITCPPMLASRDQVKLLLEKYGYEGTLPNVVQTLSEAELEKILPEVDGWIIGDDPATRRVFAAGHSGKLKAAVRWGVGTDNVDFDACKEFGIRIVNTPQAFGAEVSDVAVGYVIGLARHLFFIDRQVRSGNWAKPRGISMSGKKVGLIGYGDIGRNVASRLRALGMELTVYDPGQTVETRNGIEQQLWPDAIEDCDFLVFTCALNKKNFHMLDSACLSKAKTGVRIVNVARGPLIDEAALVDALDQGQVHSVALDVFEEEPLQTTSPLMSHPHCILGSHNGSNTEEAVARINSLAMKLLDEFLKG